MKTLRDIVLEIDGCPNLEQCDEMLASIHGETDDKARLLQDSLLEYRAALVA